MKLIRNLVQIVRGPGKKLEKPTVLQFPVIDICNSRCQMCHIWERKLQPCVTPAQIRTYMSNDLFAELRAVGLNGGEPTLRADLPDLAAALFDVLPKLETVSVITNAFKTGQVIERIMQLADVVAARGGKLDVMVSLDGYGEIHDLVRGRKGNFERARHVIEALKNNENISNFRIGCTIIKDNVYGLHDIFDFCKSENIYIKYRIGIPHKRLYTDDLIYPFSLSNDEKLHICNFLDGLIENYEVNPQQRYFYRSLIGQLRYDAPRAAGCDWRHRGATLSSSGELMYCAVESPVIVSLDDNDLSARYFAGEPELEAIKRNKCARCRHDYVGLPSRSVQLRFHLETALDRAGLTEWARIAHHRSGLKAARARLRLRAERRRLECLPSPTASGNVDAGSSPFLICGWYGTETLGDKAILGAIVSCLRDFAPDVPIELASLHPDISELTKSQMPELADVMIRSVDEALVSVSHCKALLFGGGPLMGIQELLQMRELFARARAAGRPTVIAGCGIGPVGPQSFGAIITDLLRLSDVRIFRDEKSLHQAAALGVDTGSDRVTEDPAAWWVRARRQPAVHEGRTLLLGLRSFPWSDYAPTLGVRRARQLQRKMDAVIGKSLQTLVSRFSDLRILPVPMCTNFHGDDDRWYYRSLFEAIPEVAERADWSLLNRELAPADYLGYFQQADAVLAMRFHALVFALNSGVPVVALDYTMGQGKVGELARQAHVSHHIFGEVEVETLTEELAAHLSQRTVQMSLSQTEFAPVFKEALSSLTLSSRVSP